jgi:hypothetical protein
MKCSEPIYTVISHDLDTGINAAVLASGLGGNVYWSRREEGDVLNFIRVPRPHSSDACCTSLMPKVISDRGH